MSTHIPKHRKHRTGSARIFVVSQTYNLGKRR
jgi:hypothetical protein